MPVVTEYNGEKTLFERPQQFRHSGASARPSGIAKGRSLP